MKKFFNSLRNRIITAVLLAGIIPIVFLHFVVVFTYQNSLIDQRKVEILERCVQISRELSENENIADSLNPEMTGVLSWYSDAYGGRLLVVNSRYRIILDTYAADIGRFCISDAVFAAFSGKEYSRFQEDTEFLEFVVPVVHGEGDARTVTGALVFSSTTDWIQDGLQRVRQGMYLVEGMLLICILLMAVYMSYLAVRPIVTVSDFIERISNGNLDMDISEIRSYTEINRILDASSHVIRRYQELDRAQEEFVSNVSHELRTPMTSIKVLSDSLLGQENIPEDVYQEFLTDISVEIDRESRIIEDLLSMSRLGKGSDSMNIQTVVMNDLILDILKSIRPIAKEREIELIYESFRTVTADVDEVKLNQALSNMIENAVKYNKDEGWVKVSLDADHEYFYVKIADNGVGIPEDALSHVFDRFYRVDKARSRDTGGTGLGLPISKQIVLLHYGVIKVESTLGEGTVFTIRIPLKHVDLRGIQG